MKNRIPLLKSPAFLVLMAWCALVIAAKAFAGETYAGTVSANSLNFGVQYNAGNRLSDGGCPTASPSGFNYGCHTSPLPDGGTSDAGCYYSYDAGAPAAPCVAPSYSYTGVPVGSTYALQSASGLGFCSCQNQVNSSTLASNCSQTNCVQTLANDKLYSSCTSTTGIKIASLLPDGGAALLADGGARVATVDACFFYVIADAGVKVFYTTPVPSH